MKKIAILFLLIGRICFSQTDISGAISSNTTWEASGSPYRITANTVIMDGVTLTINAGVTVLFSQDVYLKVLSGGTLIAQGTETDSIYFTVTDKNTVTNTEGIEFASGAVGSTVQNDTTYVSGSFFEYCNFENFSTNAEGGVLDIYEVDLLFSHCSFRNNSANGGSAVKHTECDVVFNNCEFQSNKGSYTIYTREVSINYSSGSDAGSTRFYSCNVENNSGGFYFADNSRSNLYFDDVLVSNCSFSNNEGVLFDVDHHFINDIILNNSVFKNHSNYIIRRGENRKINMEIIECLFQDNMDDLFYLSDPDYLYTNYTGIIRNSSFINNSKAILEMSLGYAHTVDLFDYFKLQENIFYGNGVNRNHIINSDLPATFTFNLFIDNLSYESLLKGFLSGSSNAFISNNADSLIEFISGNTFTFDLENNFWGTKSSTVIDSLIYDFNDDADYNTPIADYKPFLLAPPDDLVGSPSSITGVSLKTNLTYLTDLSVAVLNEVETGDTLFIEVKGVDTNSLSKGLTVIFGINHVNKDTIIKTLVETSENSGIFRGEIYTANSTNKEEDILKYSVGDKLVISSSMDLDYKIILNNSTPKISTVNDITINEDESSTVTLSATDANGDAITYSAVSDTNAVTVSVSSSTLTLTPNANWHGASTITAYASDGSSKDSTSFKLTVTPVNDAPLITAVADDSTNEETEKAIVLSASDIDGDALTYTATSDTSDIGLTVSSDTLKLTPALNYSGTSVITVIVSDNALTDTTKFDFKVINVNDAPVLATIDDDSTQEDSDGKGLKLSASDVEGDALTYSAVSDTTGLTVSVLNDSISLKPVPDYFGTSIVKAFVSDGQLTDSTTFTFKVLNIQDAPKAFEWVSTALDSINITQNNTADVYKLEWTESKDVDGESITYILYAGTGVYPAEEVYDTTSTSLPIPYQEFLQKTFEQIPMLSRATVKFSIVATDGIDTVKVTGDDRVVFVNRYDYLSTEETGIPTEFALHENYPNPFNPTTTLRFDLPEVSDATVTIFNMLGQKIKTFNMNDTPAGYHSIKWNATNDYGDPVGAGVYLYQLRANQFVKTKKMVLLK